MMRVLVFLRRRSLTKLGGVGVQLRRSSSIAYLVMMKVNAILIVFFVGVFLMMLIELPEYFQGNHSRILLRRKSGWRKKRMLTLERKMKWPTLLLMKKKLMNMVLLLGIAFEIYVAVGFILMFY